MSLRIYRRKFFFKLLSIVLLVQTSLLAASDFTIYNVNVIDIRNGSVIANKTIEINNNRISAITDYDPQKTFKEGAIDGQQGYVMPGLWDAHIHTGGDKNELAKEVYPKLLKYGITHVRDLGMSREKLSLLNPHEPERLVTNQPQLLLTGPLLDSVKLRWYGDLQYIMTEPDKVEAQLTELKAQGIDFFKAYQALTPEVCQAILAAAQKLDIPVVGHVPSSVGLDVVANGSQATIEHLGMGALMSCNPAGQELFNKSINAKFSQGYEAYYKVLIEFFDGIDWEYCQKAIDAFAQRGGSWTPTLIMETYDSSVVEPEALSELNERGLEWCKKQLNDIDQVAPEVKSAAMSAIKNAFTKIQQSGVTILAGTDSPNYCHVAGRSLLWELKQLEAFGLSKADVIRAATMNPAMSAGQIDYGLVEKGKMADLIVLKNNPLEDLNALREMTGLYGPDGWQKR